MVITQSQALKTIKQPKRLTVFALLVMALAVSGCNTSSLSADEQENATPANKPSLRVVTTFLPMYWFTKAVAGDNAQVEILIPPGTEVHEYQAKPADVQAIATADILVKNGLGLEEFLEPTIKNASNSKLKEINASQNIQSLNEISPVIDSQQSTSGHNHNHNHNHEQGNPHVWLDPVLAKQQVTNIRDGLIAADPKNKAKYQANATVYIQKIDQLNQQFQQNLQPYKGCTYVTFHDAYPYLARRYQLNQVAVVRIPEDNLLPADVERAVKTVRKFNVKTVLGEPGVDNRLLKSLSQDLKLNIGALDSLENGSLDPNHYFTAMQNNLQTIETACK